MAVERLIGVDFGTSTSVIRVKRYENGKPIGEKLEAKEVVFGGNGAMVPTLIMKKDDDASVSYFGYEAQQKKKKFTNFHSFKMDLESSDPAKRTQARQLTEEFYAYLAKQYKSQSDGGHLGSPDDKERTIISYPVKWSEDTKNFMLETAKKVGLPNVTGMDEAQAAIQAVIVMSTDHLQKHGLLQNGVGTNILLIDMGAGTTDLVLARYVPGDELKTEVLNTWPQSGDIQFGGREIDNLLQNFFREMLDEDDAEMLFRRIGSDKFKSWKEETVSPALSKHDSVSDFEVLDSCVEMMGLDLEDYCLDRTALEKCLTDYLKQFPELINGCLQNVGMCGNDVDLVIVTGGHSQWYFVNDMLSGKMPQFGSLDLPKIRENSARIIPISRPQETVALGLAYSKLHFETTDSEPPKNQLLEEVIGKAEFAMEIQRVFQEPDGTCVSGTVAKGTIHNGDAVCIYKGEDKSEIHTKVNRIPIRCVPADKGCGAVMDAPFAEEGEDVDILLDGIKEEDVSEGLVLYKIWMCTYPPEPPRTPEEAKDIPYTPENEFEIGSVGGKDCSIKKYLGDRTVVKIPPAIRGRKVVSIGAMAFGAVTIFQANRTIEKVIIPESVRKIEYCAFNSCSNLKEVIAHKNIENIGVEAFFGCNSLNKMDFGMGDCAEGHVIFPPNLKSIGAAAFLKHNLLSTCIFKEILMSKRTKVKDIIGAGKNFNPKYCAVFYYD